jgi:uncharacterized membrane protein YqjE
VPGTRGPASRLVEAARTSSALLLELVETRLALFASEIDVELSRVRASAVLILFAMTCFGLVIALLVLLVVAAFWDTHRLLAIVSCAGALLVAGCGFSLALRRRVSRGIPFAATLNELREDCRALRHGGGE